LHCIAYIELVHWILKQYNRPFAWACSAEPSLCPIFSPVVKLPQIPLSSVTHFIRKTNRTAEKTSNNNDTNMWDIHNNNTYCRLNFCLFRAILPVKRLMYLYLFVLWCISVSLSLLVAGRPVHFYIYFYYAFFMQLFFRRLHLPAGWNARQKNRILGWMKINVWYLNAL
jgi:hypothetical protein